jgi:hypothetical protein
LRPWWLVFLALLCAGSAWAQRTEAVYRNSYPVLIPPDGQNHYQLVPLPQASDLATGWQLSIDGENHSLESPNLRAACVIMDLPIGAVIGDAAWTQVFQTGDHIDAAFVFRAPQASLSWGPSMLADPYAIEPGHQLYLVSQFKNTGTVDLGPVTCVSFVYYRVTGPLAAATPPTAKARGVRRASRSRKQSVVGGSGRGVPSWGQS